MKPSLASLERARIPTVTERIYRVLYDRVIELDLPPGHRMSEAEVAQQMDVSRQPVRDAFYRLSQLGLLTIRPQRATTVSHINPQAVLQASFIRTAIEIEIINILSETRPPELEEIHALVTRQAEAVARGDRHRFHALDDQMHQQMFAAAGKGFAWTFVRDSKSHMDRVRFISLQFGAQTALDDHVAIVESIDAGDAVAASERMRQHLGRISSVLDKALAERPELFSTEV